MSNEDDSAWITYNGELYDEPPIRAELLAKGHVYKTSCDTETFLHLYEEVGDRFPDRLNGMFALGIWDERQGRLLLARDRMGQKPLFYAELPGGGLAFGSEPKAVLAHPEVGRVLDRRGLAEYLFYEYVPAPGSIWQGMKKIPRGHVLTWEHGRIQIRRYWAGFPTDPPHDLPPFAESARQFWGEFRDAVGRHARSDVPLGVFLSGGVDSSSVAAAMAELGPPGAIKTFSIGFDDPSFDESVYAPRGRRAPRDRSPGTHLLAQACDRPVARGRRVAR